MPKTVWPLCLLVLLGLLGAAPARAAGEPALSEVAVVGEGEVSAQPDVAYVVLGVETQAKSALEAQRENARLITAVIQRLSALGVAAQDVESSGFSLFPVRVYDKEGGGERTAGYRVSNRVSVTLTDLAKVGPVIDGAVAAGANNVQQVSFSVREPWRLQQEALRRAAGAAEAKAAVLADALGARLGAVLEVVDETAGGPPVLFAKEVFGRGEADAGPTPILPGELEVRARVRVRFALDRR